MPPGIPKLPFRRRKTTEAYTTAPSITSLVPNSGRIEGGTSVVINGTNFKRNSAGVLPTVLFGSTTATVTAVSTDGTQLTVTSPVALVAGYVDVTVTANGLSVVSTGAFVYYAGEILSIDPAYSLTSGGVQVTIRGVSLRTGSTFTIGNTAATNVVFIDDTQYVVTVPAHAAGWVDVIMTETGGHVSTLRLAFQYTTLARGSDIRRFPGTRVAKQLGSQQWNAQFNLDGNSNRPITGEEVQITDDFDSGRVIFHGIIQQAELKYEGQINQHVWVSTAGDFQYMLNKYRPFGSYVLVSASEIVRSLMNRYAPDFDLSFVQTKLALATLNFDGTKTMSEALDVIAKAIGGGRWYLDGRTLHFFNPPAPTTIVIPAGSTGTGADFTQPVLSLGSALGTTAQYSKAYYSVRVSFLYSNGTESRLGPTSNVIGSDGGHFLTVSSIPIGANPGGGITCVGRKIYYLQGTQPLANGVELDENVSTTVDFAPLVDVNPSSGTNTVGDPVTNTSSGSNGGTENQAYNFSPSFSAVPFYWIGTEAGMVFEFGATPKFANITTAADLRGGFQIGLAPGEAVGSGARSFAYWVQFAITLTYPDGSATNLSAWQGDTRNPFEGLFLGNITGGSPNQLPQYTCFYYPSVVGAQLVNGKKPSAINLWMKVVGTRGLSVGGGSNDTAIPNPVGQMIGSIPYYDGVGANGPTSGGSALDTSTVVSDGPIDFGTQPKEIPGTTQQTYIWPNPDGPYLEDFANPHDIDDNDDDLLHEDSNSQPFSVFEDITQLRNRVRVYGASSIAAADAVIGDVAVAIANPDVFPVNGGTVVAANGVELTFFSVSSTIESTGTQAKLLLTKPLTRAIPNGTTISFYCIAEDKEAQAKRGKIELDSLGNPTDGVHEYVVNDPSLNTTQAVYLRANAELSIFKDPILTIRYATRDPTRPGARVTCDLSNPPCHGTFLVQTVDIDQIRDEGDQLAPRYTVVATSVFYDLTNFLLMLTAGSQLSGAGSQSSTIGGGSSQVGIINSTINQGGGSSTTLDPSAMSKLTGYHSYGVVASVSTTITNIIGASNWGFTGNSSTTSVQDTLAYCWIRGASTSVSNANALTNNAAGFRARFNPRLKLHLRLTSLPTSQRWWIGWKQSSAPIFPNADTITGTGPGFGLRYSTVAGDSGWTLFTTDSTTFTLGSAINGTPLIQNAEYDIEIVTVGGGASFYAIVNGLQSTSNMNLPQGMLYTELLFACFQYQVVTAVPVSFDFKRGYIGRDD